MNTQTIAGQEITLVSGQRYFASRPAISRTRKVFPVTIQPLRTVIGECLDTIVIDGLTYDQANHFLAEFNNEECSLSGRVW